jgi:NADPH:quinone reductase-like Zn-dependent oxidoreductase
MMKAIVYENYGAPEVLELKETKKPTLKDNDVLIKVCAVSLNNADLDWLRGKPIIRMIGLRKPRFKILGSDVAGRIEAVGKNIKKFKPNDEVFGDISMCGFGAFAEYVCVPEEVLTLKPANMTFEEASTINSAGIIALQGIRDKKPIQPGQRVLINGAGGGIGSFAVQIAKYFGAEVTAVDSTEKLDFMLSIGADHVIDYTQVDYTITEKNYDLIVDFVVSRSFSDYNRVLSPKGILVMGGGPLCKIFKIMFLGLFVSKKMGVLFWRQNKKEDLEFILNLYESGKVKPIIDKVFPLNEISEAFQYLEEGHAKGKVVISLKNIENS